MTRHRFMTLQVLLAIVTSAGCRSLIKIDVDCEKLCLDAPGPTPSAITKLLPPALQQAAAGWDGGVNSVDYLDGLLDGAVASGLTALPSAQWVVQMNFNDVLAQLPNAAVGVSADVRLTSVTLRNTTGLDFVDAVAVTLSHGTATAPLQLASSDDAVDAGSDVGCEMAGSSLLVADFRRSEGDATRNQIDLLMTAAELNIFDCIKREPTLFTVKLSPRLATLPAADDPLVLGACVGALTKVSYP
jgi:hypothetical protein